MKLGVIIYRIIYVLSLVVILTAVVQQLRLAGAERVSVMVPACMLVGALAAVVVAALAFRRFTPSMLWILTVLLAVAFTWYGWYDPNGPFLQHEIHTFDPVSAAAESSRLKTQAWVVHSMLLLWFVSLPMVRRIPANRAQHPQQ